MDYLKYQPPTQLRVAIPKEGRSTLAAKHVLADMCNISVDELSEFCPSGRNLVGHGLVVHGVPATIQAVAPKDMRAMLVAGLVDMAVCFDDVNYHEDFRDYSIKPLIPIKNDYTLDMSHMRSRMCWVARKDRTPSYDGEIRVVTEYADALRKIPIEMVGPEHEEPDVTKRLCKPDSRMMSRIHTVHVSGSLEGYLANDQADYGFTIVQTGTTLEKNGLEVVAEVREINLNAWVVTDTAAGYWLCHKFRDDVSDVFIDGVDGTGKDSVIGELKKDKDLWNYIFVNRSELTKLTLKEDMPEWVRDGRAQKLMKELEEDAKENAIRLEADPDAKDCDEEGYVNKALDHFVAEYTSARERDYEKTSIPQGVYFILTAPVSHLAPRLEHRDGKDTFKDKFHSKHALSYFDHRYFQLAAQYGVAVVENHGNPPCVGTMIERAADRIKMALLTDGAYDNLAIPQVDEITPEEFAKMEVVAKGLSKDIRKIPGEERYHVLELVPSIYTHKHGRRAGIVPGSHLLRMAQMKEILEILAYEGIPHTYRYVGKNYLLVDALKKEDAPPIEIVCKTEHNGTDKYRHAALREYKNVITGKPIVNDDGTYSAGTGVRFDWRNPNEHVEGDVACGDYVYGQFFYRPEKVKKDVRNTFDTLRKHLSETGIRLIDMCFFATSEGVIFGEITADNARYHYDPTKVNEKYRILQQEYTESLDKDQWRKRGLDPKAPNWVVLTSFKLALSLRNYTTVLFRELYN